VHQGDPDPKAIGAKIYAAQPNRFAALGNGLDDISLQPAAFIVKAMGNDLDDGLSGIFTHMGSNDPSAQEDPDL
jgi:hypothetical protein